MSALQPAREPKSRPAVFLDRDGTLNREIQGAVADPRQLELYPGAGAALARLAGAGFALVCVTNQSALARGWITEAQLAAVHAGLQERLAVQGARLDLILHCPHHPTQGRPPLRTACACRKPAPGLLLEARDRLGLDLSASWMIGDAGRDAEAARRAGVRPILVETGKGRDEHRALREAGAELPPLVADLAAAAVLILAAAQGR